MQETDIIWADYSFNPFTGCKNKCLYCYANFIHTKRYKCNLNGGNMGKQYDKPFTEIQWLPERLNYKIPKNLPKNRNRNSQLISPDKPIVYIGSMGEISYLSKDQLISLNEYIKKYPGVIFMLLSKTPETFCRIKWESNVIFGATVTTKKDLSRIDMLLKYNKKWKTNNEVFLSISPLKDDFTGVDFSKISFLVIGAETQNKNRVVPEQKWIDSIIHNKKYFADSIFFK